MVSAVGVNQTHPLAAGDKKAALATPETGEFDFMSYLLGLQAATTEENSTDRISQFVANGLGQGGSEMTEEQPLSSKGKEVSQWNPIFPGLSPMVGMAPQIRGGSEESSQSQLSGRLAANQWMNAGIAKDTSATSDAALVNQRSQGMERYASVAPPTEASVKPTKLGISELEGLREGDEKRKSNDTAFDMDGVTSGQSLHSPSNIQAKEVQPENSAGPTVNDLFQKVETMLHQGGGKMTVHLSPPELGQVEVQVSSKGKRVEIEMRSSNDFTKSILESKLGELRHSLQSQDLVLSKMEVHVSRESSAFGEAGFSNLPQGSGAFSQSHGFTENQHNRGFSNGSRGSQPTSLSQVPVARAFPARATGAGRVDVRI